MPSGESLTQPPSRSRLPASGPAQRPHTRGQGLDKHSTRDSFRKPISMGRRPTGGHDEGM